MYRSVTILRQQLVTKPGGQPVSEPTPPGDILVLVLTRDSYTVYKTAIVMCGILRPSKCSLSGEQVDIVDLLSSLLRL